MTTKPEATKAEQDKDLINDMRKAKSGMEATLRRIEILERSLKDTRDKIIKLKALFPGDGLQIIPSYQGKSQSIRSFLTEMEDEIVKVAP